MPIVDSLLGLLGGSSGWLFSNYAFSSLNLIFFWLTWSTLVLTQSPLKLSLAATAIVRLIFFWLPAIISLLFDISLPNLSSSMKIYPKSIKDLHASVGPMILRSAINQAIGLGIHAALTVALPFPLFRITTTLPLLPSLIYDVFLSVSIHEVIFYYLHRFVHAAAPSIHALHHAHRPISIMAYSSHPLDFILLSFIPTYFAPIMRRSHFLTFLVGLAVQSMIDVSRFSGYDGLWGPAGGLARRLEAHYKSRGKVYFGQWGVLDYLHGTSPLASPKSVSKLDVSDASSTKKSVEEEEPKRNTRSRKKAIKEEEPKRTTRGLGRLTRRKKAE